MQYGTRHNHIIIETADLYNRGNDDNSSSKQQQTNMALVVGGGNNAPTTIAHHQLDDDRALAMFNQALKVVSRRSAAVAQLLEAVARALAVGETQLDSIRLDGLQATDEDLEVRR